jgi:TATA-binding protein-associated factor
MQLQSREHWEVRHGGLLGIKYLVAVRQEVAAQLLPVLLPSISAGLEDAMDDVRAVAADALCPISDKCVLLARDKMSELLAILWETIRILDDITSSTSSIMNLLSKLYSQPDIPRPARGAVGSGVFADLVPRLWQFLGHSSSGVRRSTLNCLASILRSQTMSVADSLPLVFCDMMGLLFQAVLLDEHNDVRELALEIWKFVPTLLPKPDLSSLLRSRLAAWFSLACTAVGSSVDRALLVKPQRSGEPKGGGSAVTIAGRVAAARAVGYLASKWDGGDGAVWVGSLESMLASHSGVQRHVAALVCAAWAGESAAPQAAPLDARLLAIAKAMLEANAPVAYAEVARSEAQWRADLAALCTMCAERADRKGALLPPLPAVEALPALPARDAVALLTGPLKQHVDALRALGDGGGAAVADRAALLSTHCLTRIGQWQETSASLHTAAMAAMAQVCDRPSAPPPFAIVHPRK